ncbi:MAG: RdgB/HAM1 family non-canonical purine NTP pyrophosphatase [Actinomycetes bacterium]
MIPRLLIATKNAGKREEMAAILVRLGVAAEVVTDVDWPDVEETGETLEENALLKARAAVEATGLPSLADDTGLEVEALGGAPGVHTARFAGPHATFDDNIDRLLRELDGVADRRARFRTVVALAFPDGDYVTAEGSIEGRIAEERRGDTGFGYDPVFEVGGRTFAEMSSEEKNLLSHRARALEALGRALGL